MFVLLKYLQAIDVIDVHLAAEDIELALDEDNWLSMLEAGVEVVEEEESGEDEEEDEENNK